MEENLQMSETVPREVLHTFCECIPQLYHKKYLRKPTQSDVQKIYVVHQQRLGFPRMLGSLDCTHWEWEAGPVAWQGQYHRGDHDGPTVILEAVASFDLWIWHAFFGTPGANNDVAVINVSPIFDRLTDGVSPDTSFSTNDVNYEYGYYLVNGIYPEWATLVLALRARLTKNDSGRAICQGEYNDEPEPICTLNEDEKLANLLKSRKRETNFSLRSDLVEYLWSNKQDDGEYDD
ncbi:uncharacterized protein LOC143545959 [Bidens hawaiensis]|uniref:uncharacterized protein LOC143545959 n=1 Tax=Bidens hawaiensis TaxID=980011 RepID=UPI004049F2B7